MAPLMARAGTPGAPLSTAAAGRVAWLDAARGLAIVAMVAYHASFDLAFLGFVDWPVGSHPLWRAFAAAIASTFLFLVGVSLTAAHGERVRPAAFVRRVALIGAGAGVVTLGTWLAMPVPILFGILHAIAAFSVLALPFLRAPVLVTAVVMLAVFAMPHVARDAVFAAPWAYPLGLAPAPPVTFDYEPVFPWFGATLAGVIYARLVPLRPSPDRRAAPWRTLAVLGRWSFSIYLLHQPVLFAILIAVARLR